MSQYGFLYYLKGTILTNPRIVVTVIVYCVLAQLYALGVCNSTKLASNGDVCGATTASQTTCSSIYGHICFFTISISDGLYLTAIASCEPARGEASPALHVGAAPLPQKAGFPARAALSPG